MVTQTIDRDWMTARQAAEYLQIKLDTLYHWRVSSIGPRSYKRSGLLRYRRADLDRWLEDGASAGDPA